MTESMLSMLLGDQTSLRLVVLNSCKAARTTLTDPYGGIATTLVAMGVPAVVAMQFSISDEAAIVFAEELFTSLIGRQYPVDAAVAEARKAVFMKVSEVEWATPVLFLRTDDGLLFNFTAEPTHLPLVKPPERIVVDADRSAPLAVSAPPVRDEVVTLACSAARSRGPAVDTTRRLPSAAMRQVVAVLDVGGTSIKTGVVTFLDDAGLDDAGLDDAGTRDEVEVGRSLPTLANGSAEMILATSRRGRRRRADLAGPSAVGSRDPRSADRRPRRRRVADTRACTSSRTSTASTCARPAGTIDDRGSPDPLRPRRGGGGHGSGRRRCRARRRSGPDDHRRHRTRHVPDRARPTGRVRRRVRCRARRRCWRRRGVGPTTCCPPTASRNRLGVNMIELRSAVDDPSQRIGR